MFDGLPVEQKLSPVLDIVPALRAELLVRTTSSVDAAQAPFEIVQVSVTLLPAETLVTPEVFDDELDIEAEPLETLQAPEPTDAEFAASVKLELAHCVISLPAEDVVGVALTVKLSSDVLPLHAPFAETVLLMVTVVLLEISAGV